jgi:hypothetical protein
MTMDSRLPAYLMVGRFELVFKDGMIPAYLNRQDLCQLHQAVVHILMKLDSFTERYQCYFSIG